MGSFACNTLIPELADALPRLAQLAVLGLRVGLARELAAVVLDPFADRLRVNAELGAALRYRPPVEIMQSAVSRLNSSACLADGLDTAPSLRSSSA